MSKTIKNEGFDTKRKFSFVAILLFAAVGASLLIFTKAATGDATLSLSPTGGSYNINSNFTLSIYENSGSDATGTGSVEAKLAYDTTKLTFVSVTNTGSAFDTCPTAAMVGGNGSVTIGCTKLGGVLKGLQKVGEVTFTAKVGSGTTPITFASTSSILKGDGGSTNLWNGATTGGTYTFMTPDTTPPSISITAPSANATVLGTTSISATASDNSGTVSKVEFYVNGVLKATDTSTPYAYSWDTTSIADGTYPLTAKAYDAATPTPNSATSSAVSVKVQNSKPNLVVSSISISPTTPKPGELVTITATVTNNGTLALPAGSAVATSFSVDSVDIGAPTDNTILAIGASRTATISWTATLGTHTIGAMADKTNLIAEVNESDNSLTKSITVQKPGDANNDGIVGIADLNALSFNYGKTGMTFAQGDFNNDGSVGIVDLNILSGNWGK